MAPSWSPAAAVAAPTTDLRIAARRRDVGWVLFALVLLVLAWAAYLVITGLAADRSLHRAQSQLTVLRHDLTSGETDASSLPGDQAALQRSARSAAGDTAGPLWAAAAHLPLLGRSVRSVRGATAVAAGVSVQVVPGIVDLRLRLTADHAAGGFPVAALQQAAAPLARSAAAVSSATTFAGRLSTSTGIGPLDTSVRRLQTQLSDLSGQLSSAARLAGIAPGMLGAGGPRSYFVSFENEAESRGVGGLPGAFAIVRAQDGKLTFTHFGSDTELADAKAVDLTEPADYEAQYGNATPTASYVNSDVSPDFPVAAQIWIGMWQQVSGQHLDGAIVLDPTALAALLQVTGPATLPDHSQVSAGNVIALTERDAYTRFGADNTARKAFLLDVAQAASREITVDGPAHPTALATALARMAGERRVLLYSDHPAEQAVLDTEPIAGLLAPTTGAGAVTGPYLMVDLVNGASNKVDYYLHERVTWRAAGCAAAPRPTTVTVTLTNDAPAGLPGEAGGLAGRGPGDDPPAGTARPLVSVHATGGSTLTSVTLDGRAAGVGVYTEQGRPAYTAEYEILPGQTRTLVLHLLEPTAPGQPVVVSQPLVVPPQNTVEVPSC